MQGIRQAHFIDMTCKQMTQPPPQKKSRKEVHKKGMLSMNVRVSSGYTLGGAFQAWGEGVGLGSGKAGGWLSVRACVLNAILHTSKY